MTTEEVEEFATQHGFHFAETSALTGENVLEAFEFLAYEYLAAL